MTTIVWIVGEPGVGKTALAHELIGSKRKLIANPKWTIGEVVAAGHYSGSPFDGADTIPYNGVQAAFEIWRDLLRAERAVTILDGDRFSNAGAVDRFRGLGELRCVHLVAPGEVTEARRLSRARAAGRSPQNASWVLGRRTKSERFASGAWDRHLQVDTDEQSIVGVARRVWAFLEQ